MKYHIIAILLLICGTLTATPAESTVQVCEKVWGGARIKAWGTGFVYSQGFVLTAKHVTDECKSIAIKDCYGAYHDATVYRTGRQDWVCLYAPTLKVPAFTPRTTKLQQGEYVTAYGDFRGAFGRLESAPGVIRDSVWQKDCQAFTGDVRPGYSGGPVLDANGHVVGVVSWENMITNDSGFVRITDVFK